MSNYHSATNIIMEDTIIVRERLLPPHVYGTVAVAVDDDVNSSKVVAQGRMPEQYVIIDVASAMGIDPENVVKLSETIIVEAGDIVRKGNPLATARRRRDRRRIPEAPANGVVSLIEKGRIILQVNPRPIQIYARVPGTIEDIVGARGVRIRSTGALIQCAWGNGKFGFGPFSMEPETGLASLADQNTLLSSVRGRIYVLPRPITGEDLHVTAEQELGGLVGPSMPFYLQEAASLLKVPVILTEGFGNLKPSRTIYDMLRKFQREREGAFDASMPGRWEYGKPEIVLPGGAGRAVPAEIDPALQVGDRVRIRQGQHAGEVGEIAFLPPRTMRVASGLRVPAAQVKVRSTPDNLLLPLANLEIMGDSKKR